MSQFTTVLCVEEVGGLSIAGSQGHWLPASHALRQLWNAAKRDAGDYKRMLWAKLNTATTAAEFTAALMPLADDKPVCFYAECRGMKEFALVTKAAALWVAKKQTAAEPPPPAAPKVKKARKPRGKKAQPVAEPVCESSGKQCDGVPAANPGKPLNGEPVTTYPILAELAPVPAY
jgi:hypothetical protein